MKYFLLVLVLCAAFGSDVLAKKRHKKNDRHKSHNHKNHGTKIVGGFDADIKDYPWQAFVLVNRGGEDNYYECGGTIVSIFYVISAAHCFAEAVSATIRIGSTDKFEGGHQYPGTYEFHPDYDKDYLDYDISYFKSDEEMALDGVTCKAIPIIAEGQSIPSGTVLKVSGWGDTSDGGDDSDTLRAVDIPSISNEECNEHPGYGITERQFCAGYKEGGKDHCEGDSGGPAVMGDEEILAGVVSGGLGCAKPNTPGIYVNLTNPDIRSWIKDHTGL